MTSHSDNMNQEKQHNEKKIITFRVFDMPVEDFKDWVAYAKLYFDNQMWKALHKGLELIKADEAKIKGELDTRITLLEERMAKVEQTVYQNDDWDEKRNPKTLGNR